MTELAYVYCDLGDQQYKALVHEMVTSARAVMPDVKITQISDSKTPIYPGADALFNAEVDCDKDSICAFKGHFMAEFAMKCESNLILCDVDMIWQSAPLFDAFEYEIDEDDRLTFQRDLGVLWRNDMPAMPINTGMILSRPRAKDLWQEYQEVVDNLHANGMGTWYCDQIAAIIAWQQPLRVQYLKMFDYTYSPRDAVDDSGRDSCAIHLKGDRKKWLRTFAKRAA